MFGLCAAKETAASKSERSETYEDMDKLPGKEEGSEASIPA
jgi:hypothetical protein